MNEKHRWICFGLCSYSRGSVFVFRKGCEETVLADFEQGYDILDLEGFGAVSYEELISTAQQAGADVHFLVDDDVLILQNADLASMIPDDLCIR